MSCIHSLYNVEVVAFLVCHYFTNFSAIPDSIVPSILPTISLA